jgi:ubiquitin-like 1-activating enzyme E1 B
LQIDLDTIDLSNLNRQFLFNKSHIKKSKALIASATAQSFCPSARITPHHADIMRGGPSGADEGARFGVAYFEQFDVVLNALDNLEARRHVNRMCVAARVPLVESGTAGFLGQVQPIMKVSGSAGIHPCKIRRLTSLALAGRHRVLRLRGQGDAKELPGLHHSLDAQHADPLHCLGQELALHVSRPAALAHEPHADAWQATVRR